MYSLSAGTTYANFRYRASRFYSLLAGTVVKHFKMRRFRRTEDSKRLPTASLVVPHKHTHTHHITGCFLVDTDVLLINVFSHLPKNIFRKDLCSFV